MGRNAPPPACSGFDLTLCVRSEATAGSQKAETQVELRYPLISSEIPEDAAAAGVDDS